jgi:CRP-like cAMP-binding protein
MSADSHAFEVLPAHGVLSGVSALAREALAGFGSFSHFGKGSVLVEQGAEADALHVVVSGELMVSLRSPEEIRTLGYVEEGQTVGEMGFLDEADSVLASASVTTNVPSHVWSIHRNDFNRFLASHPVAGCEILKELLVLAGRRARKGNERLASEA